MVFWPEPERPPKTTETKKYRQLNYPPVIKRYQTWQRKIPHLKVIGGDRLFNFVGYHLGVKLSLFGSDPPKSIRVYESPG
jgi:hypothetical protein